MRLRPYSTLGWFMAEAVGALEMDRTENPIMQAWMLDAIEPIDKPPENHFRVDRERGIVHVSSTPWPEAGSRAGGKKERIRQLIEKLKGGKPVLTSQAELEIRLARAAQEKAGAGRIPCPLCNKPTPKSEIDGSYPYECCNQCYWELPG
jgi:hypothetical protein